VVVVVVVVVVLLRVRAVLSHLHYMHMRLHPLLHTVAASMAYGCRHAAAAARRQPGAPLVARLSHEHLRSLHDEGRLDELPHRPVGDGGIYLIYSHSHQIHHRPTGCQSNPCSASSYLAVMLPTGLLRGAVGCQNLRGRATPCF
jgi:hypothetical protein